MALAMACSTHAAAGCTLAKIADWPVRLQHNKIIVDGTINGHKAGIMLDTGATRTMILRSAAQRLDLTRQTTTGVRMYGIGGETFVEVAQIDELSIGQNVYRNQRTLVAGEQDFGDDVAMLLGEDFLQRADLEFDLIHHSVRLFQPKDCGGVSLAYWASAGAGVADFELMNERQPQILVTVQINGRPIKALLDSGGSLSMLDKSEAARLGVTPASPGVVAGASSIGLGSRKVESWIGPFQSFTIGDETIKDTQILFADLFGAMKYNVTGSTIPASVRDVYSMLLGFDFLYSHRVLIAHSQGKIYFTYAGGPVFDRFAPRNPGAAAVRSEDGKPEGGKN
jgi:predicted aspartyl protease